MKKLNLVGKKFSRLLVIEFAHMKNHRSYWKCLCDCGNEKITVRASLIGGCTKSCGCLKKEMLREKNKSIKYSYF